LSNKASPGRLGPSLVLETYPPLSVGVKPNSVQSPTDMSRELSTVTTAASARPHFDFTMSIFPEKKNAKSWLPTSLNWKNVITLWDIMSSPQTISQGIPPRYKQDYQFSP
uniref:Uncharacterized protein n=1 Tax=Strigops habroptila TaxID=2489341 RepID=A0A672TK01_STRHB